MNMSLLISICYCHLYNTKEPEMIFEAIRLPCILDFLIYNLVCQIVIVFIVKVVITNVCDCQVCISDT